MSIDSTLHIKYPQNNSIDEPRPKDPLLDDSFEEIQDNQFKTNQIKEANISAEQILAQMNRTINSRKFKNGKGYVKIDHSTVNQNLHILQNPDVIRDALNGSIVMGNTNRNIDRGLNNNSVNQNYLATN